ncbi:flavin-containing monooxygenase [Embleya sp. NBC_00896]|uniref:flavin-containing monooxygenase n=1 Tax=Embleya sp. NBC_00896 TaxID=2975961 RepID=UPI00386973C2|nr:NAD(P)/FAD-dependent oxidoreductase [Embleya sp. NBC_00896]
METTHVRIAVIGAGFSGLATGHRLRRHAGIEDFVILEAAHDVGGTWRDNTYPGAACDVPSNLYCFSYAPNPTWSHSFSPGPEIQAYLRRCARDFGLLPHLRLGHEVEAARWDHDTARWRLTTSGGPYTAEVVIAGAGPLTEPALPRLPGLDDFGGHVFHSARWDHDHDLTGKHVAVVGTGASSIQFVPRIQPHVSRLDLYQRTAPWILPRNDRPLPEWQRGLYRRLPAAQRAVRLGLYWQREATLGAFLGPRDFATGVATKQALAHLRGQVEDPELRARLTPDYRFGCKRVLLSNDYYPALTRPNVEVVTSAIRAIRPGGIVTADGTEHKADTIVFGTGFQAAQPPIARVVTGRDGRTLSEVWSTGMAAHQGAMVAGFPNLFLVIGPGTGLGHSSMTVVIEAQARYAVDAVRQMHEHDIAEVEVLPGTQDAYNAWLDERMRHTVWSAGGCTSWYMDERNGRITALWPGSLSRFRRMNRRFSPAGHRARRRDRVG